MRLFEFGLKKFSRKKVIASRKDTHKCLFRALAQYWNPAYSFFTFGKVDLVSIVEEYTTLLRCLRTQIDKAYSRAGNVPTFLKKLM
ncbi:hypothetical protein Goari_026835 [Gossypium aridum]|uniref:Uncharacterized protein n=1 Tax=Gossypium aridum TaxID=34290 RepID=A0A7J8YT24_GOSAI|nr:hypothetical protein [Gossypium aridum]